MIEKYDAIFNEYKDFIEDNSQYNARVVKYNTNTSTYFPLITLTLSNSISTDSTSIDKIEYYDELYFTIDIYTKDKIVSTEVGEQTIHTTVASQIINEELIKLTLQFFGELNMKRTLCRPTPNLDTSILRTTIQYQCLIGNARGNIIRR